jgi:hypothetical protein
MICQRMPFMDHRSSNYSSRIRFDLESEKNVMHQGSKEFDIASTQLMVSGRIPTTPSPTPESYENKKEDYCLA